MGRTWPTVLWKLSSLRWLQCGMSGPRSWKLLKKKKNLAPGMVLVMCPFIMPGLSSLPFFPEGSCPNRSDYCPFAEHSAPSGPSNFICSLFFWRASSFIVFLRCWGRRPVYLCCPFSQEWWLLSGDTSQHTGTKCLGRPKDCSAYPSLNVYISWSCHSPLSLKHTEW